MNDLHYEEPALADLYDLDSGWSIDRDFYLALAGATPIRILDLGCGTGLLANAYAAKGHTVTGLDPAQAMLDIARAKPHGTAISWAQGPAQTFRSELRFDLIVTTGHTFQVLLDDADRTALFATIRTHLAPSGRAVFETRNPALAWDQIWSSSRDIEHNGTTIREWRHCTPMQHGRITFDTHYQFPDRTLVSTSTLAFPSRAQIETDVARAGLTVDSLLGDWNGNPFDATRSEEMIFTLRH